MLATMDNGHATDQGEALPVITFLRVNRFLKITRTMSSGVESQTEKTELTIRSTFWAGGPWLIL